MLKNSRAATASEAVSFSDKVFNFLDRTEYRRISSQEDLDEIGRFRFRAFDAKQIYPGRYNGIMLDEHEHDSHAQTFGVYFDGSLVSSVRLQRITPDHRVSPSFAWFPGILNSLLDQGMSFMEPNRMAVDVNFASDNSCLPHIMLRLAVMATRYHSADACISCVKKEHVAFYRRYFNATLLAGPIIAPGITVAPTLLANPRSVYEDICSRFPFYRYLRREAELLFGAPARGVPAPLTVLPTARLAIQQRKSAAA